MWGWRWDRDAGVGQMGDENRHAGVGRWLVGATKGPHSQSPPSAVCPRKRFPLSWDGLNKARWQIQLLEPHLELHALINELLGQLSAHGEWVCMEETRLSQG